MAVTRGEDRFSDSLPDPRGSSSLDDLVACLERTRVEAGSPSHRKLAEAVTDLRRTRAAAVAGEVVRKVPHQTINYLFRTTDRTDLDYDLVFDLLAVLRVPARGVRWWREAWATVGSRGGAPASVEIPIPSEEGEFFGRSSEVERVLALSTSPETGSLVISIEGMGGLGKTRLATYVARRLVDSGRHDDVQLLVNLHGFDTEGRPPAEPGVVLEQLIRALRPAGSPPSGRSALVRAYRNLLLGRSAVIVLDNAVTEEQVQDLLPGHPGTMIIVTSRNVLAGLPDVVRFPLSVLSEAESANLLRGSVGRDPQTLDDVALRRVVHLCGRLPLALTVAAAQLREDPRLSLSDYAEHREELGLHDEVESSLALSYEHLAEPLRRFFRLLSLHPGPDFDVRAAAALGDRELGEAGRELSSLVNRRLLDRRQDADRYQFHDLVRAYAAARTRQEDLPRVRRAAVGRVLDHYRSTAATAMDFLAPYERHRRPQVDRAETPTREDDALAWLDEERHNLATAATQATAGGWHQHAVDLSQTLFRYLVIGGYHRDAHSIHEAAVRAAQAQDDSVGEAVARQNLGVACWQLGDSESALRHLREALATFLNIGDHGNVGRAHNNLGLVHQSIAQHAEARDNHQAAAEAFRAAADDMGVSAALGNLALVYWNWGEYTNALVYFRQDLALARRAEDRDGIAIALGNMGGVYQRIGQSGKALARHRQALSIYRRSRNRAGIASALMNIGTVHECLGQHRDALDHHQQALAIYSDLDDVALAAEVEAAVIINEYRLGETAAAARRIEVSMARYRPIETLGAEALNRLGEALRLVGRDAEAYEWFRTALRQARQSGERYQVAKARDGLAHLLERAGRADAAIRRWREALLLYAEVGVPEAEQTRERLARLDSL